MARFFVSRFNHLFLGEFTDILHTESFVNTLVLSSSQIQNHKLGMFDFVSAFDHTAWDIFPNADIVSIVALASFAAVNPTKMGFIVDYAYQEGSLRIVFQMMHREHLFWHLYTRNRSYFWQNRLGINPKRTRLYIKSLPKLE